MYTFIEMPALDSMSGIITILVVVIIVFILFRIFKVIMSFIVLVVFLIAAYITNPSFEEHVQAVKDKGQKTGIWIKSSQIKVENFKVLSLTKVKESDKLIGIGAFTKVWIFNSIKNL